MTPCPGARGRQEEKDRLLVRRVVMSIEEIFESDIDVSLIEIHLDRQSDGSLSLSGRRGVAQKPFPVPAAEGGYWSSDRSD